MESKDCSSSDGRTEAKDAKNSESGEALSVNSPLFSEEKNGPADGSPSKSSQKIAQKKEAPISTVRPDGKRDISYWDGPDGVLKRATAFLYKRIISPREIGGMQGFFEDNCLLFKGTNKSEEQSLEFMPL